jgi:methionyl-tRNA synthetase
VPYFLSRYDPDPLRFYLTASAPETRDTEFSWEDFVERNNNELVATWGNLAQHPRGLGFMLSFATKRFDGVVPEPGDPSSPSGQGRDDEGRALLEKVEAGFETVGELYNACKFRTALGEAMALAREANGYLDRKAPWFQIKEDPQAAATSVYVILRVVDNLKTLLAPILPHTAQRLHEYLGYDGQLFGTRHVVEYQEETRSHRAPTYGHSGVVGTWAPSALTPGQALRQPSPLFRKLDESVIEEEYARLEGQKRKPWTGIRRHGSRGTRHYPARGDARYTGLAEMTFTVYNRDSLLPGVGQGRSYLSLLVVRAGLRSLDRWRASACAGYEEHG